MEPMIFARQVGAAIVLVTGTLVIHCIGMAAFIHLVRARIERGIKGLSPLRSSILMVRFTTAMIVLHVLEILLWAGFYRWHCFRSWEPCIYFLGGQLFDCGLRRRSPPACLAPAGPGRRHRRNTDERPVR